MMKDKIQLLRKKGVVLTIQRLAVLNYLQEQGSHPTAEEIHRALRSHYPTLSLATVYNTLETLKQAGLVSELVVGKEKRFDLAEESHHHFHCRVCGRIYDVPVQCSVAAQGTIDGHAVETVQALFIGVCADCVRSAQQVEDCRPYRCAVCGWVYDPARGNDTPGTPFSRLPEDWCCKVCGAARDRFVPVEVTLLKRRTSEGDSSN
ncbi:MAG: transcriptional repressor [bacterium]|nr:transcriptional repressor [candidate division KSB1 bacterium]MDH7559754.1 transcriptional repressor [bacterium]